MKNVRILLLTAFIAGCANDTVAPVPGATETLPALTKNDLDTGAEPNTASTGKETMTDNTPVAYNRLTEFEEHVIVGKGTERPFVGEYTDTEDPGTYICRRCNAKLYQADHKFLSDCGWPAFDDEIEGAVTRHPDADGRRVEIVCTNCEGHLGHVFQGEQLTKKNVRHCVNSVSMVFVPKGDEIPAVITAAKDQ